MCDYIHQSSLLRHNLRILRRRGTHEPPHHYPPLNPPPPPPAPHTAYTFRMCTHGVVTRELCKRVALAVDSEWHSKSPGRKIENATVVEAVHLFTVFHFLSPSSILPVNLYVMCYTPRAILQSYVAS